MLPTSVSRVLQGMKDLTMVRRFLVHQSSAMLFQYGRDNCSFQVRCHIETFIIGIFMEVKISSNALTRIVGTINREQDLAEDPSLIPVSHFS